MNIYTVHIYSFGDQAVREKDRLSANFIFQYVLERFQRAIDVKSLCECRRQLVQRRVLWRGDLRGVLLPVRAASSREILKAAAQPTGSCAERCIVPGKE